jgi:hypothetical protein
MHPLRHLVPAAASLLALLILPVRPAAATPDCSSDPVSPRRIALVIGNSGYGGQNKVSGRKNAVDVACDLEQLGFTLVGTDPEHPGPLLDAQIKGIQKALERFNKGVRQADVALFFFSGHGFQQDSKNYLLPVPAEASSTKEAPFTKESLLELQQVIDSFHGARIGTVEIILLDACRDNQQLIVDGKPLSETPGWLPGMARVQPDSFGGVIGFATLYNQSAKSGPADGNSPYTLALLAHLRDPGLEFHRLLTRAREDLAQATEGGQASWEEGNIGSFALRPAAKINAKIEYADDDLVVATRDGRVLLSWGDAHDKVVPVTLEAGDTPIELRVYNQKTYRHHHAWEPPEGWKYKIVLTPGEGVAPTVDGQPLAVFKDKEEVVFKDGPHHGKWFRVATATIHLSAEGKVTVGVTQPDLEVWKREGPAYATGQTILCGVTMVPALGILNLQHPIQVVLGGRSGLEGEAKRCAVEAGLVADLLRAADPVRALGIRAQLAQEYAVYLQGGSDAIKGSQVLGAIAGCVEGRAGQPIWYAVDDGTGDGGSFTKCDG